jgi:hypothetical protein
MCEEIFPQAEGGTAKTSWEVCGTEKQGDLIPQVTEKVRTGSIGPMCLPDVLILRERHEDLNMRNLGPEMFVTEKIKLQNDLMIKSAILRQDISI